MRRSLQFLAGLIGIVILLAIVEFLPAPRHTYFWDRTFDTGHILVFGIGVMMSLTMVRAFLGRYRKRWQYVSACLGTLALGLVVEVWQSLHGRTAEWIDVYNDAVGIAAFAAIYAILDQRIKNPRTGWLRRGRLAILAGLVLILGLLPFFETIDVYRVRYQLVPSLVDFGQPWYAKFYYERSGKLEVVDLPANWPSDAKQVAKVAKLTLNGTSKYPGFVFREPHPNWSDYGALEVDVLYGEPESRKFAIRVHDFEHDDQYDDRFNATFTMRPGFQTLRFTIAEIRQSPSGRQLNLRHIESFSLFTDDLDSDVTFFLGDIRLVP